MYGNHIGSLNVYSTDAGKTATLGSPIWSRSYNMGNQWRLGQKTLYPNGQYQVIFEGVIGDGYNGDISLDDITVSKGECDKAGTRQWSISMNE